MTASRSVDTNRTKIARRVFEVLDYLSTKKQSASVMDIVRTFGRPQSSTSELLRALTDMGILSRDSRTRTYSATLRLTALAYDSQPHFVRNGRLFSLMDDLAETTRRVVGLFGMVGIHAQVIRFASPDQAAGGVHCGATEYLSSTAAGLVLLAGLGMEQSRGLLWRLNAETRLADRFNIKDRLGEIARIEERGHAIGPAGFAKRGQMAAVPIPQDVAGAPLALGVMCDDEAAIDTDALVATLKREVDRFIRGDDEAYRPERKLFAV